MSEIVCRLINSLDNLLWYILQAVCSMLQDMHHMKALAAFLHCNSKPNRILWNIMRTNCELHCFLVYGEL